LTRYEHCIVCGYQYTPHYNANEAKFIDLSKDVNIKFTFS